MLDRVPGYVLWQLRAAKRRGRKRRRFCDKIGHGPWATTSGCMQVNGRTVQSDWGRICQQCEHYEQNGEWRADAAV